MHAIHASCMRLYMIDSWGVCSPSSKIERGGAIGCSHSAFGVRGRLDLPPRLRVTDCTFVWQQIFTCALPALHEHAGELDGVVDRFCRAYASKLLS